MSLPRNPCFLAALMLLLLCLHAQTAGAQTPDTQASKGWQGLARVLDAITPSVDTSAPFSAKQITDHIASLLARGMFDQALHAIMERKSALNLAASPGTDVQLLFLEARTLAALNRHAEAIEIYRHMTQHYPELPQPWNNLAAEYILLNQPERAQEALRMALVADPNDANAQANLGIVQLMLAQQSLQQAAQSGVPDAQRKAHAVQRILTPE